MCESERPGVDTEQARSARGALRCAIAGCALVGAGAPSTSPPFCTGSFRARARGQTGRQRAPAAAPAPGQRHDALKLPIRAACASPARCAHAFASPARPASRPASPLRAVGHGVPNSHRWFEAGRIADPLSTRIRVILSSQISENSMCSVVSPYACVGARERKQKTL